MDPVKVLLIGSATDHRELEHKLWCDGRQVAYASAVSAVVSVRTEGADVAIYSRGSSEALSTAYPELPILEATSAAEAVRWVRTQFLPLSELVLSDRTVDLEKSRIGRKRLTPLEVSLLRFFAANPERMVSIEELLRKVWGYRSGVQSRTATTAVYRLRQKIEVDPRNSRHLLAGYGRGYSFVPFVAEACSPAGNLGPPKNTVGRASEKKAVLAALVRHRFVGLVGAPGVGKSHLALDVARSSGQGSAWLVELSGVRDTNEVVDAVRRTLGIAVQSSGAAALPHALAARGRMLLVLDACEEAVEAIERVAEDWIATAPNLRILATSRTELGSVTVSLGTLSPDAGYELFLSAARRRQPEFAKGSEDEDTVRQLVDTLEGVPLALELSAARAVVLGPKDLLIAASNPLSSGGKTLRDAITRSWDLLDPEAQSCLSGCSVFAGEFDLAAFQDVVGGSVEALTRVESLSLLRVGNQEGGARYSLFDSIRQFASEHLEEQERLGYETSHAEHFAGTADVANCLAAWHRFRGRDPFMACRVSVGLLDYFRRVGPPAMLKVLLQQRVPEDLPDELWVEFRCHRARLRWQGHDVENGLADHRAAVARASGTPRLLCTALYRYADALVFARRPREALSALERAESLQPNLVLQSVIAKIRANAYRISGDPAAEAHYERAVTLARKAGSEKHERVAMDHLVLYWTPEACGDYLAQLIAGDVSPVGEAYLRSHLARIRFSQDRTEEALVHLEWARDFYERIGLVSEVAMNCVNIGAIRAELGQAYKAEIAVREALAAARHGGQEVIIGLAQMTLGMLCLADGRLDEGERLLLESRQYFIDAANENAWVNAGNIAILKLVRGHYVEAIDTLSTVRKQDISAPGPQQFAAYEAMARGLVGDFDTAADLLKEASEGLENHRTGLEFVALCGRFVETLRGSSSSSPVLVGPFGSDARLVMRLTDALEQASDDVAVADGLVAESVGQVVGRGGSAGGRRD